MFVVKCYNAATGHVEAVSDVRKDASDEGLSDPTYRDDTVSMFAERDTSDSHVYYADTVSA